MIDLEKQEVDGFDFVTGKAESFISYKCTNDNLCAYLHDKWTKEDKLCNKPAPAKE